MNRMIYHRAGSDAPIGWRWTLVPIIVTIAVAGVVLVVESWPARGDDAIARNDTTGPVPEADAQTEPSLGEPHGHAHLHP
ncbi:MAG: hypothetical protein KIT60_07720 [Burkholderiaceae bacterium]|nr:hypothetical protein [Burkholderiaceae bacterium]